MAKARPRPQVRKGLTGKQARQVKKKIGLPSAAFIECPYYAPEYCPKHDVVRNLQWRLHVLERAARDKGLQRDLRQACFEDVLFWCNFACFVYEPRSVNKVRGFCTWPHQDPVIITMDRAITDSEALEEPIDVVVDKSRGQGATWMYLLVALRRWLRDPMFAVGLVSRNEKLVDSLRDPDTLLWKVAFAIGKLPSWLLPEGFDWAKHRNLSEHSISNPANGATFVGFSATGDVARGGRKSLFCLDELGAFKAGEDYAAMNSTAHVTNCRFIVSTFLGDSGAYYDCATQEGDAIKVVLDWKDNPTQNNKLYRLVKGTIFEANVGRDGYLSPQELSLIRHQHQIMVRRGYVIQDKLRNIWYNRQCLRPGATPRGIAQELDRDPKGSVSKVFDGNILKVVAAECVRDPVLRGRLVVDMEQGVVKAPYVIPDEDGEFSLWVQPNLVGDMPVGLYVAGADVSAGTAGSFSSNSVVCVVDRMTGQQVAEWASNNYAQLKFAYIAVAIARWFHGAQLIPEANYGSAFLTTVWDQLHYYNVWHRKTEEAGTNKTVEKIGFWMTNDDVKLKLFETLQSAMAERLFIPRSKELLAECPQYEWRGGKIVHIGSTKTEDESAKGKAHGDRVIAASLANHACCATPILPNTNEDQPLFVPPGSMAQRLKEHDMFLGRNLDPWEANEVDIFSLGELRSSDEWR